MFCHSDHYEDAMIVFPAVDQSRGRIARSGTRGVTREVNPTLIDRVAPLSHAHSMELASGATEPTPELESIVKQRIKCVQQQKFGQSWHVDREQTATSLPKGD